MEDSDIIDADTDKITDVQTVEYTVEGQDKPLLKDKKTGKFVAGTGSSGKGGRKPGSKDRVSQQLVDIAQSLMERRGAELLEEVADRAPEQALALITKIIPASELQKLFEEDRAGQKGDQPVQVNIGVVRATERLQDTRSQAQIETRQRGLESRIERVTEPVEDVVSTQDDRDEEAAREARERAARQRDAIKAHGGLTGRPRRSSAPDTLPYRDEDKYL